ncbi:MAG: hypothetical protein JWQ35_1280 [Bacteriovoracaceae bacterium]|nr:hypothetical protein [Bacteriovoracaceae bacterium]
MPGVVPGTVPGTEIAYYFPVAKKALSACIFLFLTCELFAGEKIKFPFKPHRFEFCVTRLAALSIRHQLSVFEDRETTRTENAKAYEALLRFLAQMPEGYTKEPSAIHASADENSRSAKLQAMISRASALRKELSKEGDDIENETRTISSVFEESEIEDFKKEFEKANVQLLEVMNGETNIKVLRKLMPLALIAAPILFGPLFKLIVTHPSLELWIPSIMFLPIVYSYVWAIESEIRDRMNIGNLSKTNKVIERMSQTASGEFSYYSDDIILDIDIGKKIFEKGEYTSDDLTTQYETAIRPMKTIEGTNKILPPKVAGAVVGDQLETIKKQAGWLRLDEFTFFDEKDQKKKYVVFMRMSKKRPIYPKKSTEKVKNFLMAPSFLFEPADH